MFKPTAAKYCAKTKLLEAENTTTPARCNECAYILVQTNYTDLGAVCYN